MRLPTLIGNGTSAHLAPPIRLRLVHGSSSSSGLERLGSRSTSVMPMTEPDRPTGDGGGDESRGRPASTVRGRGGGEDRPDAPAALVVNPLQQVEHRDNK